MRFKGAIAALAGAVLVGAAPVTIARAAEEGCHFNWPLETEIGWFKAAKVEDVASGTELPGVVDEALSLALLPLADAKLPVPPSRTRDGDGPNAGAVTFADVVAGTYQVTIASDGWVDLVQGGAALKAGEHTGSRTCADARKSVRYQVAAGKLTVQVSAASGSTVKIAVKRLE